MSASPDLKGWVPVSARVEGDQLWADLCLLEDRRFIEPFFEDTITRCMYEPFHAVFRRRVDAEGLAGWLRSNPPLPVAGFIFHMSRCGSTLVSQLLAASAAHRVMSEAGPIDVALRGGTPGSVDDATRVAWLRAMVGMLGQAGSLGAARLFVKFDSWHASLLPLIQRAFPSVPWILMIRDPVEVIVSHLRRPGAQMVPGMVGYTPPGVDPQSAWALPRAEYCARMLGALCEAAEAALEGAHPGLARVVDYASLPEVLDPVVWPHFGLRPDAAWRAAMAEVSSRHAKEPSLPFEPDGAGKRAEADEAAREAALRWVGPVWQRLRERSREWETASSRE